jgi:hypothetical protein
LGSRVFSRINTGSAAANTNERDGEKSRLPFCPSGQGDPPVGNFVMINCGSEASGFPADSKRRPGGRLRSAGRAPVPITSCCGPWACLALPRAPRSLGETPRGPRPGLPVGFMAPEQFRYRKAGRRKNTDGEHLSLSYVGCCRRYCIPAADQCHWIVIDFCAAEPGVSASGGLNRRATASTENIQRQNSRRSAE